jgi:putative glutamine amidotransferase
VQWHPEWRFLETPFYAAIFKAFGQACRERQSRRESVCVDALRRSQE